MLTSLRTLNENNQQNTYDDSDYDENIVGSKDRVYAKKSTSQNIAKF